MGNLKESDKHVEAWHKWLNLPFTKEEKKDRKFRYHLIPTGTVSYTFHNGSTTLNPWLLVIVIEPPKEWLCSLTFYNKWMW